MLHKIFITALLLCSAAVCFGQAPADGILASSAGKNFTAADLSPEARHAYDDRKVHAAEFRGVLQRRYITRLALDAETTTSNKTEREIIDAATANLGDPTDA